MSVPLSSVSAVNQPSNSPENIELQDSSGPEHVGHELPSWANYDIGDQVLVNRTVSVAELEDIADELSIGPALAALTVAEFARLAGQVAVRTVGGVVGVGFTIGTASYNQFVQNIDGDINGFVYSDIYELTHSGVADDVPEWSLVESINWNTY
ncbi:hypothetical protein [Shouchella miscanthi]|uniref:Uncharacterized protein n=1 Tax=Shouchella miscanthi TaxID=2598861 RepID=A0ABU6NK58_9BACI|nr:hypothetical protein [Shouchella miscanthi]